MARIRSIKPDIWDDERFGRLSLAARLLFIGLISQADDSGRMRANERLVSSKVFPYDNPAAVDTAGLLVELNSMGMITLYSVNGFEYLEIPGFTRHQKIDKPSPSVMPGPSDVVEAREASQSILGQFDERSSNDQVPIEDHSLRAYVRVPLPSTPIQSTPDPDPAANDPRINPEYGDPLLRFVGTLGHIEAELPAPVEVPAVFVPPGRREVVEWFRQAGSSVEGDAFYKHYSKQLWCLENGGKMSDWPAAARAWMELHKPRGSPDKPAAVGKGAATEQEKADAAKAAFNAARNVIRRGGT